MAACNKKVTESLIKAGAFDSLKHARKGLFLVHTDAVDSVLGTKKAEAIGQFDLFGGADEGGGDVDDPVFTIKVPDEEWDDKHKLGTRTRDAGPVRVGPSARRRRASADHPGRYADPGHPRRRCRQ